MLKIIDYPNPILSVRALHVTNFDEEIKILIEEMIVTMYATGGVGLAAPQVGCSQRIVIIDPSAGEDANNLVAMINPVVTWVSEQKVVSEEGCLSLPRVRLQVPRSIAVNVEYHDAMGNHKLLQCRDVYMARIIQHEVDHLDGLTMLDRVGPLARKLALKGHK